MGFSKYFGKHTNLKSYGLSTQEELLNLIKDAVAIKDGLVVSQLSDDLDDLSIFLKLSEENRRERQRRIDAGDETVRLNFSELRRQIEAAIRQAEMAKQREIQQKQMEEQRKRQNEERAR